MSYLATIEKIAQTRSRNEKMAILRERDGDLLRDILVSTYHPLQHYYLKKLPWSGTGNATLLSTWTEWTSLLDQMSTRSLSGDAAKGLVSQFIKKLTPADADLFKKVLKKDLRAGMSYKTINSAFGDEVIPVFGVMRAKEFTGTIDGAVYMSLKLDGLRGYYREGHLYTRNGHKIHGVEHILERLEQFGPTAEFDGELLDPTAHFQDSSGSIRSHSMSRNVDFHIFDTGQADVDFKQRYESLLALDFSGETRCVSVVKHVMTSDIDKIFNTFHKALALGHEGLMLKTPHHRYQHDKRSTDWQKLKDVKDEDLTITEVFEGQGKYVGMAGGFTVTRKNGVEVRVGTGLSDEMRTRMWDKPEEYIGVTAELQYHENTKDGSMRHPRLIKLRFDK